MANANSHGHFLSQSCYIQIMYTYIIGFIQLRSAVTDFSLQQQLVASFSSSMKIWFIWESSTCFVVFSLKESGLKYLKKMELGILSWRDLLSLKATEENTRAMFFFIDMKGPCQRRELEQCMRSQMYGYFNNQVLKLFGFGRWSCFFLGPLGDV